MSVANRPLGRKPRPGPSARRRGAQGTRPGRTSGKARGAARAPFGRRRRVSPRGHRGVAGGAGRRPQRGAQGAGGGRNGPRLRGGAERARWTTSASSRSTCARAGSRPAHGGPGVAHHRRRRRLWARHAGAGLRHRSAVSAARQAGARRREGGRGAALRAVGPEAEGRPCDPHGRGVPEAGPRRHDDPHHAARGAIHHRRQDAVRDAADAVRQADRRQDRARIRRRQARRARRARPPGRRVALSRRAERQGRQGRLARSQHAVLDRQIRLSRAQRARAGRRRPVFAARIRAVSPLRGIPVVGALPSAFSRRPRRGAAQLRRPAADRPPARLFDPRGPDRRRTLHEALFPGRQGRRRSDRDRLRGAGGAPGQADAGVRPLRRALAAARHAPSPTPRISRSRTTASTSSAPTCSSAIRSI